MAKRETRESAPKLRAETDKLARQAKRTKEQLDKVQDAADALVERADKHKTPKAK